MKIETLGQAREMGWRITARCSFGKRDGMKSVRECTHSYELDFDTLIWTRGHRFPLSDLPIRLKCPRCGSRRVAVLYDLPSDAQAEGARITAK